jgi:acetylornithine/succinyldiaminopimelate/putrescine aminotransferase
LKKVYDLTRKHNCLLVTDVVQAGIRRTGYINALEQDLELHVVKPDFVTDDRQQNSGMTPSIEKFAESYNKNLFSLGIYGSSSEENPLSKAASIAA